MSRITDTNSANASKGSALGFEGDQFMVVLVAVAVGVGILVFCHIQKVDGLISLIFSAVPVLLSLLYLYTFHVGKPPGYRENLIRQWLGDTSITLQKRNKNPYYKAN